MPTRPARAPGEGFNLNLPLPWGTGFEAWSAGAGRRPAGRSPVRRRRAGRSRSASTPSRGIRSRSFRLRERGLSRASAGRIARLGLPTLFVMEGGYASRRSASTRSTCWRASRPAKISFRGRRPRCCCRPGRARRRHSSPAGSLGRCRAARARRCRSARLQRSAVERVDLGAICGREGRVLLDAMRVKAVDPEDRIVDAVADAIGAVVRGKLHDPTQTECAQRRIVECGGAGDVRDTDAGMVEHDAYSGRPVKERRAKACGRRLRRRVASWWRCSAALDEQPAGEPTAPDRRWRWT